MNSIVDLLTAAGRTFVDILLYPFSSFGAESSVWGLLLVSVISGVLFLILYGKISAQGTVKKVKRGIGANLLEAVLYRHDLRTSLGAQTKMFGGGFLYFMLAVPPILIMLIPCVLILAQLELRYGARPLRVGEAAVLSVKLRDASLVNDLRATAGNGVTLTSPVRIPETGEVAWRVDPKDVGLHPVTIELPSQGVKLEEHIAVGTSSGKIEPGSYSSWAMKLLYPSSIDLQTKGGAIEQITLPYPATSVSILGLKTHWLVIFGVISILAGIIASRIFHVEI